MINPDKSFANKKKQLINELNDKLRVYWMRNVKQYFNLRETKWGLDPKTNHRYVIAPYSMSGKGAGLGEPRLRNAIMLNWVPSSNMVTVRVAPIMVKSQSNFQTVKVGTRTMTEGWKNRARKGANRAYDLIDLLSIGTHETPGAYVRYRYNGYYKYDVDMRVNRGVRHATTGDTWNRWMNRFIAYMDSCLQDTANKLADAALDDLSMSNFSIDGIVEELE